jgi:alpha-L-fucosidase 2
LTKLPPIKVGRDGTIQEWIKDYEEAEPGHRHMSHLLGLYPLAQITPETPDLFEAAKKTIEKRLSSGGGHTGWSRAWIISFYARLLNAEKAHENVLALLKKSTLDNLFDTHPPFQIDGNFGGTAGIAEMLLQSHNDVIHILPALPKAWASGSVRGLRARGGFQVDIHWKDHDLEQVEILSHAGQPCQVRYNDKIITLQTQKGKRYLLDQSLRKQD